MSSVDAAIARLPDKSMLVLDDDDVLRIRLGRALSSRGFEAVLAPSVTEAMAIIARSPPAFAVVDMRLDDGSGLTVVEALRAARPDARIVMVSGYGSISTAVRAMKAGAVDYLAKPADADEIAAVLLAARD